MKILHIISDTVLGGAQRVCIDLANCAVNDGNEVAVAAMSGGYLWEQLTSNVKQFQLNNMEKSIGFKDFKVVKELKQIRNSYRPDIIHLHTSKPGILGRWVFRKEKEHIVYTVHGFDQIRIAHKKFLPVEKYFQKYTGAIVAVSEYDKLNMSKCGINKNISLIYNGIDSVQINKKDTFPISIKEKKVVLTIARIAPPKDFDLFINVASAFEHKDVAFVWIGGAKNKTLDDLRFEYNIPSNVYLLGDLKNASEYINLCDIFVLFSKHEGLPMSIIEAMSQGKAVVASNVGGIPELVSEENGALILNYNDSEIAINKILENFTLRNLLGLQSLSKYENNFTLEKMWNEYKKLYLSLLS